MQRRLVKAVALALVLSLVAVGVAYADPQGVGDCDEEGQVTKGKATFTKLENKDIDGDWSPIVCDGISGWVQQRPNMPGRNAGSLTVKGLLPDTWYMVTLWAAVDETPLADPENGLFGGKTDTIDWTDVTLLKTDENGNGGGAILNAAELVGGDCSPAGVDGCVPGMNSSPILVEGDYSGVHVDVKMVGSSADGTTPDMGKLMNPGGAGDDVGGPRGEVERWLFEWAPLSFTK